MSSNDQPDRRSRRYLLWSAALLALLFPVFTYLQQSRAATIRAEDLDQATTPPALDGSHPCISSVVSGAQLTTRLSRCFTPAGQEDEGKSRERYEVDLRYGTFVLRQTDLEIEDAFNVPLTRTYLSQDWITLNGEHAFGHNASHPYDIAPLGTRNPYTHMRLVLEDGDFLYFKRISPGSGFADAVYLHTETSTRFYKSTIAWNGDGWTLRLVDGSTMRFPEAYNSKTMAQGAALEEMNPTGEKLLLHRDHEGNLQELLTPHKRQIHLEHDEHGRITRARDDRANWVTYTYNDAGMLIHVVPSSGEERTYEYDGVLMTAILDKQGKAIVRNSYSSGILVDQVYSNGDVYHFDYVWNKTMAFAVKAAVTFPDHSSQSVNLAGFVPEDIRNQ